MNSQDQAKVSVIIGLFNVSRFLEEKRLSCVLGQTWQNLEIILVNDGSTDHTPDICRELALKDSRIVLIDKTNGGLVSARNIGVQNATGKYICYVDGDDWIEENLLETVFEKGIKPHAPDMVVFGAIRQYEDHQVKIPAGAPEGLYEKKKLQQEIYPYMMYDNRKPFCSGLVFPVAWNKVYKRELLKEHYCEEERIRMGEDNAFIFECLYVSEKVVFLDDYLYIYNQLNDGSFIHSYDPNRFDNNKILTEYIDGRLGGKNEVLDSQINAFKAYWLIMAVFHEMKSGRKISEARNHIRKKIKETQVLSTIKNKGLPTAAVGFITLLRMHLYYTALIGAKILSSREK